MLDRLLVEGREFPHMRPIATTTCLTLLTATLLAGCASWGPVSPEQRARAQYDVPRDHPHPPGVIVSGPPNDTSMDRLRCWNNGQETVCDRSTP